MATEPCLECGYDTDNICELCGDEVCEDCLSSHEEWEHSDQESEL